MKGLEGLTRCILTNDKINSINTDTFENLTNLWILDLSWNNISVITTKMFLFNPLLIEFRLSNNYARIKFETRCFSNQKLMRTVSLSKNDGGIVMSRNLFPEGAHLESLELTYLDFNSSEG
jgi:Leucine-rich repeat (LRR) protein